MAESFFSKLRLCSGLLFLCVVLLAGCTPGSGDSAPAYAELILPDSAGQVNVLFIAIDDLRPELGVYGKPYIHSPNIDSLARTGTVFLRAYAQQAACTPSRTSMLTGLRPDAVRVWDLDTHFRNTVPDVVTLPQHFKRHGYQTIGLGKIFHGGLEDEASWSVPSWRPAGMGLRDYALEENIKLASQERGPAYEKANVPDSAYADGKLTNRAVRELRELAAGEAPFFLAVGFAKPHLPFNAPARYWELYDPAQIELAGHPKMPEGAPPFADTNWKELRFYHGIPEKGPLPDSTARRLIHGYYAAVSYIDAQVGRLLAELDSLRLQERTIVVLWGDHGFQLGEHGEWTKHTNFELDTRAPLIVSVPGRGRGHKTDALVEFVDIYPTLSDLAGLPQPSHVQGVSFAPLLDNPDRSWKTAAFSQYPRGGEGEIMGYSMRTDRYRFTQWHKARPWPKNWAAKLLQREVIAVELYDHEKDPKETVNLADHPDYEDTVRRLTEMMEEGWEAARPALAQ